MLFKISEIEIEFCLKMIIYFKIELKDLRI